MLIIKAQVNRDISPWPWAADSSRTSCPPSFSTALCTGASEAAKRKACQAPRSGFPGTHLYMIPAGLQPSATCKSARKQNKHYLLGSQLFSPRHAMFDVWAVRARWSDSKMTTATPGGCLEQRFWRARVWMCVARLLVVVPPAFLGF